MDKIKGVEEYPSQQWLSSSRALFDKLCELNKQVEQYNDENIREETLELYHRFSQSLMPLANKQNPWDQSMALWGDFAEILLSIVINISKKRSENLQNKWIKPLKDELFAFQREEKTSYIWFLLYCDRLTYVIDKVLGRANKSNFNPEFIKYKQTLLKGNNWKNHESYLKACENTGDRQTRKMSSPIAQAKLFPHVVCLPYPGLLSDWDLVKYFPSILRQVNLWLCGFPTAPVFAEGVTFSPSIFFAHDYRHLAVIVSGFSTYQFKLNDISQANQVLNKKVYQICYDFLVKGRGLFDRLLENTVEIIEDSIENRKLSKEEEGMFKFFTFVWVHEGRYGLFSRIYQAFHNDENWWIMGVNNSMYYKFLFPRSIQALSDDERLLIVRELSNKYVEFLKNKIDGNLKKEISIFLKAVGSQAYGTPFQYRFPDYIYDETYKKSSENYLQIIHDTRDKRNLNLDLEKSNFFYVNVIFPGLGLNSELPLSHSCWVDAYTPTKYVSFMEDLNESRN